MCSKIAFCFSSVIVYLYDSKSNSKFKSDFFLLEKFCYFLDGEVI